MLVLLFFQIGITFNTHIQAQQTYTSNQIGVWTDSNIWNVLENGNLPDGTVPGLNDGDVVIVNHGVTYNMSSDDVVASITVANTNASSANLTIRGPFEFTVQGSTTLTADDFTFDTELTIVSEAIYTTSGIDILNDNGQDDGGLPPVGYKAQVEVNNATLTVNGDFTYERTSSLDEASDGTSEILIGNSVAASFNVTGELLLKKSADVRGNLDMNIRNSSDVDLGTLKLETTSTATNDGDITISLESGTVTVNGLTSMIFNSVNDEEQKQYIEVQAGSFTTKSFLMEVQNTANGSKNSNIIDLTGGIIAVEDQMTVNQDLAKSGSSENRINLDGGTFKIGVDGTTTGGYDTNYPFVSNERFIIDFGGAPNGTLELAGNDAQSVPPVRNQYYGNLTINNSSSSSVTLRDDADIHGNLTMTDGVLNKDGNDLNFQELGNGAVGADMTSYVDGSITKIGTGNTLFPVGSDGQRGVMEVTALNDASDQLTVQYFKSNPGSYDYGLTLDASEGEYWEVEVTEGGTPNNLNLKIHWDDGSFSGSNIPDDLGITNDLFPSYVNAGTWTSLSNPLFNGDNITSGDTSGDISSDELDNGSPVIVTFGSSTTDSFLPVILGRFEADILKKSVRLNWSTLSEINNQSFTIERSIDGVDFHGIGVILGSGNTSFITEYEFIDDKPVQGISYYKLIQRDYDGVEESFLPLMVEFQNNENDVLVFPNPVPVSNPITKLNFKVRSSEEVELEVYNSAGQLIKSFREEVYGGVLIVDLSREVRSAGVYLLSITDSSGEKFIHRIWLR